jgi:ketosteroid isomerase-like protein
LTLDPIAVIRAWFSAFARGDLDEARRLYADDGVLHTWYPAELAGEYRGLDEAWRWFQRKGAWEGQNFSYEAEELMGGERYAVALLRLATTGRSWRQTAVYRIADGQIREVWLFEEPH